MSFGSRKRTSLGQRKHTQTRQASRLRERVRCQVQSSLNRHNNQILEENAPTTRTTIYSFQQDALQGLTNRRAQCFKEAKLSKSGRVQFLQLLQLPMADRSCGIVFRLTWPQNSLESSLGPIASVTLLEIDQIESASNSQIKMAILNEISYTLLGHLHCQIACISTPLSEILLQESYSCDSITRKQSSLQRRCLQPFTLHQVSLKMARHLGEDIKLVLAHEGKRVGSIKISNCEKNLQAKLGFIWKVKPSDEMTIRLEDANGNVMSWKTILLGSLASGKNLTERLILRLRDGGWLGQLGLNYSIEQVPLKADRSFPQSAESLFYKF